MRITAPLVLLTSLALLGACGSDGAGPDPECTEPAAAASVALADFEFSPACIGAAAGGTISLENTGAAPHTFTVDGTDVDVDIAAGDSAEASLVGVEPGRYAVTCTYHPQMTATLVAG